MEWICLLFPACIALKIRYQRNKELELNDSGVMKVLRWASWVLILNVLTVGIILLAFGFSEILTEAFVSFSFSLKYILLAMFLAGVLPYIVEIKDKYFSCSVQIEEISK